MRTFCIQIVFKNLYVYNITLTGTYVIRIYLRKSTIYELSFAGFPMIIPQTQKSDTEDTFLHIRYNNRLILSFTLLFVNQTINLHEL